MVKLVIDNKPVEVEEGTTILEAARQNGIDIPTLCFLKDINEVGDCRMCIVEVEGRNQESKFDDSCPANVICVFKICPFSESFHNKGNKLSLAVAS